MTTINLKDFYAWYTHDEYIEVSDEVAAELKADKLYEAAYQRRTTRNKAQYSLDCDDGIEYSACLHEPTPQELLDRYGVVRPPLERPQLSAGGAGHPGGGASDPRQELPPDCPGAGRGQKCRPIFCQKRQGGYEKIFEKISVKVSPFARFLSLVYER